MINSTQNLLEALQNKSQKQGTINQNRSKNLTDGNIHFYKIKSKSWKNEMVFSQFLIKI